MRYISHRYGLVQPLASRNVFLRRAARVVGCPRVFHSNWPIFSLSASRRVRPLGLVLSTWNFLRDFLPFVLDMSLSGDRTWEITSRAEAEGMWSVPTGSTIFFLLSMFLPVDLSSLDGAAADFLGRLRNGILDGAHHTGHVYYHSHLFFFFVIVPTSLPWNVSKHARCLRQSRRGLPRFLSDRQ